MNHWLQHTVQHLQIGEALMAGGTDGLIHGWMGPADILGKLCTGAERWQATIRQMQTTVNLADILRARTFL
jgi:hypothetical protein